jgi:hypothetical protein
MSVINSSRLGFYRVGKKIIMNKVQALLEAHQTGNGVDWVFNHQVYSKIDWSEPIETPLLELYRLRAQQLRDQYDYLVLSYSGGADSTMVLHSFIDNNIFLDEILIQFCEPAMKNTNNYDTSNANFYSEIEFAANAHLRKFKNQLDPRTKIRYQDFSKTGIQLLNKDNWFDSSMLCVSTNISGVLRQLTQNADIDALKLHDKARSTVYIYGIEKPLVYFDGIDYFGYFTDTSTYHYATPFDFLNIENKNVHTEFFFWTPSMPEIVVKQAQEVKKYCEMDSFAKYMISCSQHKHISEYRDILHPLIYPDYVIESFQTEKPSAALIRDMDKWFWDTTSNKVQGNYLSVIDYLRAHTDYKYMINYDVAHGISSLTSKFYKL